MSSGCEIKLRPVGDAREIATRGNTLCAALQNEHFDFAALLASGREKSVETRRPRSIFPPASPSITRAIPTTTLIQIETPDRLGLLYDLVACLGRNNVYIALARISTEKGAAIDTFYVTDAATRGKITDPKRIEQLQQRSAQAAVALAPNEWTQNRLRFAEFGRCRLTSRVLLL